MKEKLDNSYIFQQVEGDIGGLNNEKYNLVDVLNYCSKGHGFHWSFEAPSVLLIISNRSQRRPQDDGVDAHRNLKGNLMFDLPID